MPTATKTRPKTETVETPVANPELEFTLGAAGLKETLGVVTRFVPSRSTLPVLGCVKIESAPGNGGILVTGSNLEQTCQAIVPATVTAYGAEVCVEARKLHDWIRLQDDDAQIAVRLDSSGRKLVAKTGSHSYTFQALDGEDFPPLPDFSKATELQFPTEELKLAIDQVVYAAAPDDTRPVLAGAQFTMTGTDIAAAAADGFRLAARSWVSSIEVVPAFKVIVPAKFLAEVVRVIGDADGPVCTLAWVGPNPTALAVHFDRYRLTTRLIEGQFPDYPRIIPPEDEVKVDFTCTRKAMLRGVRASEVAARDNSHIVRFKIEGDAQVKVWSQASDGDLAETILNVEWFKPAEAFDFDIAFNGKYLVDLLGALPSDEVRVQFTAQTSPGLFRPVGISGNLTNVVMPMHVAGQR